MGDAFLKGYYTIHDNDDHTSARMGFAPHAESSKSLITEVAMPTTDVMDVTWELNWIGMSVDTQAWLQPTIRIWLAKIWTWFFGIYPLF